MEKAISDAKLKEVEALAKLIDGSKVVGAINLFKMPAPQLQKIKKELHGRAVIRVAKKNTIKHAIAKSSKPNIVALEEKVTGQAGLLFSSENPFSLYKLLEKSKSPAPAKPGMVAPKDIVIPVGGTGIAAGPAIGQLQKVGLKTAIKEGKISVAEDKVVVKAGQPISNEVCSVLGMLNIKPIEIGLDLLAAYEDGTVYGKDILAVDEKKYEEGIIGLIRSAINLSLNAGYLTKQTAETAIIKAHREARMVGIEAGVFEPQLIDELIAKAHRQAMALKEETKVEV